MKKTLLQLSVLLTMLVVSTSINAQDLYLIIGQSNASGRDDNFDYNGADLKTNDVQLLSARGRFWSAKQPLNRHSNIKKTNQVQGVNIGLEFGKQMHEFNGNKVYLVVNARGGTKVAQWRNKGYRDAAIERVREAEDECNCQLKGILWHQGEGDTKSTGLGYTSSYISSLQNLINEFRTELNRDVPFIVGQIAYKEKNVAFNEMIQTVTSNSFREDNVDWVSAEDLTTIDGTHFSADSTRELGRRYAYVMQQYVGTSSKELTEADSLNENTDSNSSISVSPNPTSEIIHISGVSVNETFIIYDMSGAIVMESEENDINVSELNSGSYVISTSKGNKVKFLKN